MRLHRAAAAALVVMLAALPALATPFEATLEIGPLGSGEPIRFEGSGSATSIGAEVELPGGTFQGTATGTWGDSPKLKVVAALLPNLAGSFSGTPLAGKMLIRGVLKAYADFGMGLTLQESLPLQSSYEVYGLGVGGMLASMATTRPASFSPWFVVPDMSGTRGVATTGGTDQRTPAGLGSVTLVSPTRIGTPPGMLMPSRLRLRFVPEPAAPLLLGAGAALLAMLGWRRRAAGAR
jgi:hypothetical protein